MLRSILDGIQSINEFFIGLIDSVVSIAGYISSLAADLLYITLYIGQIAVGGIIHWFSFMPILLVSVMLVLIGIAVVYKLMGRE